MNGRQRFDPARHETWTKKNISKAWNQLKQSTNGGYDRMFVLTVVTSDRLPTEKYTKDLQKSLMDHFEKDTVMGPLMREEPEDLEENPGKGTKKHLLYLCLAFKEEEIPNYSKLLDLSLTETLPTAREALTNHVDEILKECQTKTVIKKGTRVPGCTLQYFYIGKTSVCGDEKFNPLKRTTWGASGIGSRWSKHKHGRTTEDVNYDVMFVLAAVTDECVPTAAKEAHVHVPTAAKEAHVVTGHFDSGEFRELYTFSLEQSLISHYLFEKPDRRLRNTTTDTGKKVGKKKNCNFILYLCLAFDQPDSRKDEETPVKSKALKDGAGKKLFPPSKSDSKSDTVSATAHQDKLPASREESVQSETTTTPSRQRRTAKGKLTKKLKQRNPES